MAATASRAEGSLVTLLLQLVVIIVAARVVAAILRRLGQPTVVGEIAAGLLLGPSCFGYFFPKASAAIFDPAVGPVFEVFSQLGLILLLFVVGLEFDFSHLRLDGKAALGISLMGIALPFALGLALALVAHAHLEFSHLGRPVPLVGFALFMGVALSITAIPVLARIMMELNLTQTRIGAMTISAAAVEDACGWILLATISGVVEARFQILRSLEMIVGTVGFVLLMLLVARPLLKAFVRRALRRGDGELGLDSLAVILVLLLLSALVTSLIGIFAIFGAFLLGTMLSDEVEFRAAIHRRLRDFLTVFFLPVFFTYTGLRTNVGVLTTWSHWILLAGVLAAAIAGKLGGCALAARLAGVPPRQALAIGTMMNTRGLMELVVINVGRDLGVIPPSVFCMLALMALFTTAMTTPLLLRLVRGTELEPHVRRSDFLARGRKDGRS